MLTAIAAKPGAHESASRSAAIGRLPLVMGEFSGALGDLGTFLPLALALTVTTDLEFSSVLVWAGIMNIMAGWCFRQPIPVQPMKALAAVAITHQLPRGEIAAAGLAVAILLIIFAFAGIIDRATRIIPKALIRGVQLAIGLQLMLKGFEWLFGLGWSGLSMSIDRPLPLLGADSLVVAAAAAAGLCLPAARRLPMLVPIFVAGLVLAAVAAPQPLVAGASTGPLVSLVWPALGEWKRGLLQAGLPQFPLTLMNSVVAVCALSADYFPGAGISPRRMALQVGVVNLIALPFGAMPMCHGAGGLAAQHRFGAKTGLSSGFLGMLMIAAAMLAGGNAACLLARYPISILGVMLILAGWALAGIARDCLDAENLVILIPTVGSMLVLGSSGGFLVGVAVSSAVALVRSRANG